MQRGYITQSASQRLQVTKLPGVRALALENRHGCVFSTSSQSPLKNTASGEDKKKEDSRQNYDSNGQDKNDSNNDGENAGSGKTKMPWEWYLEWLDKQPLLTKALTSSLLVAVGDIVSQLVIEKVDHLDGRRLLNMSIIGGCLIGPTLHFWYGALNRLITGATSAAAIGRLCCDQFLFAPFFIATIFGAIFALEGRLGALEQHLRTAWPEAIQSNWRLWIPAMFITFRFVPPHLQVLWVNFVALWWNTYLSYKSHEVTDDHSS